MVDSFQSRNKSNTSQIENFSKKQSQALLEPISEESDLLKINHSHTTKLRSSETLLEIKTPIQVVLRKFIRSQSEEFYIYHTKIFLEYDDENAFLFIFQNSIVVTHLSIEEYSFEDDMKPNPMMYMIELSHVYYYELQVNEHDGNIVLIQFFENDYNKKSEIKFKSLFLKDSYFIHHFIKKYFIIYWQKIFETSILLECKTLFYHYHFFVQKLNRWGSLQDRILLITNRYIYNIKHSFKNNQITFSTSSAQWADAIKSIVKVAVIQNHDTELRIYYDKDLNQGEHMIDLSRMNLLKFKKSKDFHFHNEGDKKTFIYFMRRNYYNLYEGKQSLVVELIYIS